jgi:uncharacterized protein YqcC (DUF446 family)
MPQKYSNLAAVLMELEAIMRRDGFWHHKSPSPDDMNSSMPFAVDKMEITDWLQFIFIPRMQIIIQQQLELPATCSIAPAAEVALMGRSGVDALIAQLQCIDAFFAASSAPKISTN